MASRTSSHQLQHPSQLYSVLGPQNRPLLPIPCPRPSGPWSLATPSQAPSSLLSPPSYSPTPSHPRPWEGKRPPPSLERKPQAEPGTARGKGELLCPCQQEVPVFSHSRTQAHSRVDSPGTVNRDTPLNTRGHSQVKKQTHTRAPTLFTPQQILP